MPAETWTPWPDLAEMMERAKQQRLCFWSPYQDLWLTPEELQSAWNLGLFRWGAVNWKLRDPAEKSPQETSDFRHPFNPGTGTIGGDVPARCTECGSGKSHPIHQGEP